jgi:SH3-like domain-containing protein
MRRLVALVSCCCVLLSVPARGDQAFPYKTVVASDDVYVRSGPGQNYYPTDKLKKGQEVEVYRHDPGGWCAIRPVEGSFTWVAGRYLKPTEEHMAVVTQNGVSARVGSRFSDLRDVVQVRLQKGEQVEILEGPPRGAGENGWYKIAPPSGEFRWVSAKYLDANYPREGVRKQPPAGRYDRDGNEAAANVPSGSSAPEIPAAALAGSDADHAAGESHRRRVVRPRPLSPEEFQAELDRLDMELSTMVIQDSQSWSLDGLRDRTNQLLDQAQTAVERGRARLLANKIARFDDIKQRQDAVLAMHDDTDRANRALARLRPQESSRAKPARSDVDGRFDGVGQLTQVVSPKMGAPRYALVDDKGDVRCYVTPAPGVNVQNYLGREVGIVGNRGYMPEQRASHIMARHITPLEDNGTLLR